MWLGSNTGRPESNPPARGMLEPSDNKTQLASTHFLCYGRHAGQGVALFESPENVDKVII